MANETIKIVKRTETNIPITYEQWGFLEDIFMGGNSCDTMMLDTHSWEEEWRELMKKDTGLYDTLQRLCKDTESGTIEIGLEL